jgi:mRNA-degrading endonuclease RelE of RelBE toxin-antitoxin system
VNYKLIITDEYLKKLKKFIKKHPDILDNEIIPLDIGTYDEVY